jgi:hypothetical protein
MPNRIIREGINSSERVNSLDWAAEVFYRRLHSVVDDFGRYPAHTAILRAALYPLKLDTVREANVERFLVQVRDASLVRLYEVEGKRYLEVLDFRQQRRAKESKYPDPPGGCVAPATHVKADATPPISDAHLGVSVCGVGDVVVPPNPRQAGGEVGGDDPELPKEELWQRVCEITRRNPKKPRSGAENDALYQAKGITESDVRMVERYAVLCRKEPDKYTAPKELAHTLLYEFHAEVSKAVRALGTARNGTTKPPAAVSLDDLKSFVEIHPEFRPQLDNPPASVGDMPGTARDAFLAWQRGREP